MDLLKMFTICLFFGGCSALGEAPIKCDLPCGPCDLGQWSCQLDSCELGQLKGILNDDDACTDVSFVSTENEGPKRGTQSEPFTSIASALNAETKVVIVSKGVFNEPIILRNGIGIIGGYQDGSEVWKVSGELTSIIAPSGFSPLDVSNAKTVTIENFAFFTESSPVQIGAQIIDVENIKIENCTFDFESSPDGKPSPNGINSEDGGDGGDAKERAGGDGGVNLVCGHANGGKGGKGAFQNNQEVGDADVGESSFLGVVGGRVGENGKSGVNGADGAKGKIGEWDIDGKGRFIVKSPTNGGDGSPGQGGSGGGGSTELRGAFAYSGGGGGAGGCGGAGGKAGENGGFIVGITLFNSSMVLNEIRINLKEGGTESAGGMGGGGGKGGDKGKGGVGVVQDGEAADGGVGGAGGAGGSGGDGIDGFSFGVACFGEKTNLKKQENVNIEGESNEKNNLPNCD